MPSTSASSISVSTPFPISPATASSTGISTSVLASSRSSSSTLATVTPSSTSTEMPTPSPTSTDIPSPSGVIDPGNSKYSYYGCYNETTALNQTSGRRALYGGSMEALDTMTVAVCLNFCNIDGFAFGGLEYTDECWCAQYLNVYAVKLPDSECNLACKGNTSEICGGALKLSVYQQIVNPPSSLAPRSTNVPTKLFIVGLAIAGLLLEML